MRTCEACGRVEDDPAVLLGWTTSVERGERQDLCVACSREHLRSIEGKLDAQWW